MISIPRCRECSPCRRKIEYSSRRCYDRPVSTAAAVVLRLLRPQALECQTPGLDERLRVRQEGLVERKNRFWGF